MSASGSLRRFRPSEAVRDSSMSFVILEKRVDDDASLFGWMCRRYNDLPRSELWRVRREVPDFPDAVSI